MYTLVMPKGKDAPFGYGEGKLRNIVRFISSAFLPLDVISEDLILRIFGGGPMGDYVVTTQ